MIKRVIKIVARLLLIPLYVVYEFITLPASIAIAIVLHVFYWVKYGSNNLDPLDQVLRKLKTFEEKVARMTK